MAHGENASNKRVRDYSSRRGFGWMPRCSYSKQRTHRLERRKATEEIERQLQEIEDAIWETYDFLFDYFNEEELYFDRWKDQQNQQYDYEDYYDVDYDIFTHGGGMRFNVVSQEAQTGRAGRV